MTYLVLRFSSIGNVAMLVPLIASLSENYPEDRFVVVCEKRLGDLFFGMSNVESVAYEGLRRRGDNTNLFKRLRKQYHIDAVIDLQDTFHTHLLRFMFRFCGAKVVSVMPNRIRKFFLCQCGGRWRKPLQTETERYRSALRRAGLVAGDDFSSLPVNQQAADAVGKRFGVKKGRWIGVAPFAKHKTNRLDYQTMKEVLEQLSKSVAEDGGRVFLFGAGDVECEMLLQWASIYRHTQSVAGQLSLAEELELMRRLDVMLCMDSANQHLASLVGLRVVSVWCGTHPKSGFYGWKQNPKDCLQKNLSCRPCTIHGKETCRFRNFRCKEINAEQIMKLIAK